MGRTKGIQLQIVANRWIGQVGLLGIIKQLDHQMVRTRSEASNGQIESLNLRRRNPFK